MSWFDLLILNTSLLDLICYPVLIVLVVVVIFRNLTLSKRISLLEQEVEHLARKGYSGHDILPLDEDLMRALNKQEAQTNLSFVDDIPSEQNLHLIPSDDIMLDQFDIPSFSSSQKPEDQEEQGVVVKKNTLTAEKPKPVVKEKYTPNSATLDISSEDAQKYILEKITGNIAETVKKFPQDWKLESLKKTNLTLLFNTFKHHTDETAKQVTKKLYLLLNPKASES